MISVRFENGHRFWEVGMSYTRLCERCVLDLGSRVALLQRISAIEQCLPRMSRLQLMMFAGGRQVALDRLSNQAGAVLRAFDHVARQVNPTSLSLRGDWRI